VSSVSHSGRSQTFLAGQGHLLITDSDGRRLGYVGGTFVSEVPSAVGSVLPGGLGLPGGPIYYLPLTETYTIQVSGQALMATEPVAVSQVGAGYVAWVEDVAPGVAA